MSIHLVICGLSGTGKSFLAKQVTSQVCKRRPVVVYDPMLRTASGKNKRGWHGLVIARDEFERFYGIVTRSKGIFFVVDEIGIANEMGLRKRLDELFVTARNDGNLGMMIAQRYKEQMTVTARTQCLDVRVFTSARHDGEALANDFNCDEMMSCNLIPPGHYIAKRTTDQQPRLCRVNIPNKQWPAWSMPASLARLRG